MPTAQLPRGANLECLVKKQSAFKTPADGNYKRTLVYSFGMAEQAPFEDDNILGLTKDNTRDATQPGPGLSTMAGSIVAPLDFSHLRYWLELALGTPTTTGEEDFVHTFESGAVALPEATIERVMARSGGSVFLQSVGVMVDRMTLAASRQAGFARMTLECVGYGENKLNATGAGTPVALATRDPIAAALGVYKIDSATAARVLEVNLTYANNLQPRDEIGDGRVSGFDIDVATLTGSLRMRFENMTLFDAAVAGTSHAGELLFEKSADRSLSWAMPAVRLERVGVPNEGPGGIDVTFNLRAEQMADAPMLTSVLKGGEETF